MIKINLFNVRDEARRFAREVVVPIVENSEYPWRVVGELARDAIAGSVPDWFKLECETLEFDDVDLHEFFREVVIQLPTWLL